MSFEPLFEPLLEIIWTSFYLLTSNGLQNTYFETPHNTLKMFLITKEKGSAPDRFYKVRITKPYVLSSTFLVLTLCLSLLLCTKVFSSFPTNTWPHTSYVQSSAGIPVTFCFTMKNASPVYSQSITYPSLKHP